MVGPFLHLRSKSKNGKRETKDMGHENYGPSTFYRSLISRHITHHRHRHRRRRQHVRMSGAF